MHRKPKNRKSAAAIAISVAALLLTFIGGQAFSAFVQSGHKFGSPTVATFNQFQTVSDTGAMQKHTPVLIDFRGSQSIRVRHGETLSSLAAHLLGSGSDWPILWWDNRSEVPNPNNLRIGIQIHYGTWHIVKPWLQHRADSAIPAPPRAAPAATRANAQPTSDYSGGTTYYYGSGGFQACVIARESGGDPQITNSTGHYGLYQFSYSTWIAYGGAAGDFGRASVAEQNQVFYNAMATPGGASNWAPYDGC